MNKKLITLMTAAAIIASGTAVFAVDTAADTASQAVEATAAPEVAETLAEKITPSYISKTVTITEKTDEKIETTLDADDAENPDNTVTYTIAGAVVIDGESGEITSADELEAGETVTVYSNVYDPAPLILPPQYSAAVIVTETESRFFNVDTYIEDGDNLVNLANTLCFNLSDAAETAVDTEGNAVDELINKDLIVIYTSSTRSIPAQTAPEKIIVLGENEHALAQLGAPEETVPEETAPEETSVPEETAPEATEAPEEDFVFDFSTVKSVKIGGAEIDNFYKKGADGTLMLPLRKIAETLGYTVGWNGETREVTLNGGEYSLQIGADAYVYGDKTEELGVAPEITNDLTFVPVDCFIYVLGAQLNVDVDNASIEFVTE